MQNENKNTGLRFDIEKKEGLIFNSEAVIADNKPAVQDNKLTAPADIADFNSDVNAEPVKEKNNIPVKTTYVPRFTSASENYRITGTQNRPVTSDLKSVEESTVDPTAEIEANDIQPIVVVSTPDKPNDYVDERIKIYKFSAAAPFAEKSDADLVFSAKESGVRTEASAPVEVEEGCIAEAEPVAENVHEPEVESKIDGVKPLPYAENAPLQELGGKSRSSEFNVQSERDSVKDKFLDSIMSVKVRLLAAVLISVAILTLDSISFFGDNLFGYIGLLYNGQAVVDLLFASSLLLLIIPELLRSIMYLKHRILCPELAVIVSYLLLLGYTLTVTLDNQMGVEYMGFAMLFAIEVLAVMLAGYFRKKAEFRAFKLISRSTVKHAVDIRNTRTLEVENLALDGAVDEYNSKIARVFDTAFVSDFHRRAAQCTENSVNVLIMLGTSLFVGLVAAVVAFLTTSSPARVVAGYEALLTVFLVAMPVFSIILHKLTFKDVVDAAASEDGLFVGEASIYEGSEVDVISYKDTEVFGTEDVSIKKVHLYGKVYNTGKAMRQMYALFSDIGGPLKDVFSASLDRKCPPATDTVIEEDGVIGSFEGHCIMAGTEEFMRRHNVTIPEEDYKTKGNITDSTKVMYGAEDGEVYVKFFIRYSFSEEFTMILPELISRKIVPLIYSTDPNINSELLRMLTLGEDNIRVMHVNCPIAEEKKYRRVSSGIVSVDDRTSPVSLLLLARKYVQFQSWFAVTELISTAVGAALAAVVTVAFSEGLSLVPEFALAFWQVAWCGVLFVRSKMTFKVKKEKDNA